MYLQLKSFVSLQSFWVQKDLEKDSFSWTETAAAKSRHPKHQLTLRYCEERLKAETFALEPLLAQLKV